MSMNRQDRDILVATRDALDEALTAMAHGEPSLQNGAYDQEAWQGLMAELEEQSKRATAHLTKTAVDSLEKLSNMKADIRRVWTYRGCKVVPVDCQISHCEPKAFGDGILRNRYWRIEFPDGSWVATATKQTACDYVDHRIVKHPENWSGSFVDNPNEMR